MWTSQLIGVGPIWQITLPSAVVVVLLGRNIKITGATQGDVFTCHCPQSHTNSTTPCTYKYKYQRLLSDNNNRWSRTFHLVQTAVPGPGLPSKIYSYVFSDWVTGAYVPYSRALDTNRKISIDRYWSISSLPWIQLDLPRYIHCLGTKRVFYFNCHLPLDLPFFPKTASHTLQFPKF